jgi:RHS repeat-associated protein
VPAQAAQQATITITGTVQSGTDGNPASNPPGAGNVFGFGSNLAGEPFTLTIRVSSSEGTYTSGSCSDGSLATSSIGGSNTASTPTATLQIGSGSFTYGSYPLQFISWRTGRSAKESCSSYNDISLGWSETYNGSPYIGSSGFGGATLYTGVNLSGDLFSTVQPAVQVATPAAFHFSIGVTDPKTLKNIKYAGGYLAPQSFSVEGTQPLAISKTLGICICLSPTSPNSASPISSPLGTRTNPLPLGLGIFGNTPNYTPVPLGLGIFAPSHPGVVAVGDPITIATGNVFERELDYATAGQNRLQFIRSYNSMTSPSGTFARAMGVGWRSNYDRYIVPAATTATIERPDGQVLTFTQNSGAWTSDTDVDVKLVQSGNTWTLTDLDDTIETYTTATSNIGGLAVTYGRLAAIQSRNGYTQTLNYDASNELISVTDSYGRALSLTYSGGLLSSVTTPDALVLSYGYANGVLTSVTYSTTPETTRTYLYENASFPYALTGIIDENGSRFATWTYDAQGRALSSQHGGGADLSTIGYDDTTGDRTVTNALGQQETYKFATLQGVPKLIEIDRLATATTAAATRTFAYDAHGYLAKQTDWNGNITTYVNDVHGQPTTTVEASGTPQARTTTMTYHASFHLPLSIVTPELSTAFSYDADGELLTKTLTDTTTTTVPYSTKDTSRAWTSTWTNFLLASTKGPRTDVSEVTNFGYDGSGALTSITNALGQVTKITAHTGGGLPLTIVDPNGVTTNLTYNPRQWLLTSTLSTSAGPLTATLTYDAAGNLVKTTPPDGSALTNSYDTAQRLTGVTDLFGQKIAYTLDANGDITETDTLNATGTTQRKHSGIFDALGRILHDIGGAGQTVAYGYDSNGNALTVNDPLGHLTQRAFDPLNRLTHVTDAAGGITTLSYDPHDRPVTVIDPNNGTTTYVYDGVGDVIQQISPDTGTTVYRYDPDGNLTQKTDARGAITNYTYDALSRAITTTYPADAAENVTYSYDQAGHGFGIGRLTSVRDAVGSLSRKYDERGNVLSETRVHGSSTLLISTSHDKASRVTSFTYPSGWIVSYVRDGMGRITATTAQSPAGVTQNVVAGVAYQPFGPADALTYGNGVAEARTFDLDYRLLTLNDNGKAAVQSLTYGYDANDNVSSISDGVTPASNQKFGYDVLDHLTGATGGYGSLSYSYSPIGNRLTQTANAVLTSYTYNPHSNQLAKIASGASTQTVSYTAAGNTSAFTPNVGAATTYTYNQENRLASATVPGQFAQYAYDAFGHRLVKSLSGNPDSLYQYDQTGNLLEEINNGVEIDYIYFGSRPVATIQPSSGKLYFLHDDRLGTPQVATDAGQAVQWAAAYQPFGQTSPVGAIIQNLRFPGQEFDAANGLYHNGFRNYVPGSGRYLESDLIGLEGGLNSYGYVDSNPSKYKDVTGLIKNVLCYTDGPECELPEPPPVQPPTTLRSAIACLCGQVQTVTGQIGNGGAIAKFLLRTKDIPGLSALDIFANLCTWAADPTLNNYLALFNSVASVVPVVGLGEAALWAIGIDPPWVAKSDHNYNFFGF